MSFLTSPESWIALLTLTLLEIVLGVDNIVFVSILAGKLPWAQQSKARTMGLALERKNGKAEVKKGVVRPQMNTAEACEAQDNGTALPDLKLAAMLRCRVRYFTDGAVIGSKAFVNEAFAAARERFTERRKDGARRMKGSGKGAAGVLWSVRDLRVRLG